MSGLAARLERLRARLPWLHRDRADVLAAVALAVRRREPVETGLARLAAHDPLLQPWCDRLVPALAAGATLPQVLREHRLIGEAEAVAMTRAEDPVAAMDAVAAESLAAPRGLWLVRWFPVALITVMLVPLGVLQATGVFSTFEQMFRDLNIRLPAITVVMIESSWGGMIMPLAGGAAMWCLVSVLRQITLFRHLTHLWWVEVHRQAALLALVDAARVGDDEPVHLDWPLNAVAGLYYQQQDRPPWNPLWRTWWTLTRLRAPGPDWKAAGEAATAVDLLRAIGLLPAGSGAAELAALRESVRSRLRHALAPAVIEARGLLLVAFALGFFIGVLAVCLPIINPWSGGCLHG